MSRLVRSARKGGLVLAGVGSILAGVALVNALIRPGVIDSVGTATLAAILALLLLPAVAFVAIRVERSTPAPVVGRAAEGLGHEPAPRRSPMHRRRAAQSHERQAVTRG